MEIKTIIDWLVGMSGLFTWILFVPQIKLLIQIKESRSNSLFMSWGSWILQVLVLTQSLLNKNWSLAITFGVSVFCLSFTLGLIHYYRRYPGGR